MPGKFLNKQEIGKIVDGQMQHRAISQDVRQRINIQEERSGEAIDFITISYELGSAGEEVARILADQMKWQLYDKEILDYMSENMNVHVKVLESVDERTSGWIHDWLLPLLSTKSSPHVEQLSYYKHLGNVLMVLARHGQAVIVGRAAGHLLPRERGLSIRVTAPFDLRCQRYAHKNEFSVEEARQIVSKRDDHQRRFVKDFVNDDIDDPLHYDLVCSTEKLSPMALAKLIWRAFDRRVLDKHEKHHEGVAPIEQIVAQDMKQWEDHRAEEDRGETYVHLAESEAEINYITVARELGSGGGETAALLAQQMNWQLYDKEILDYMAQNMKVHVQVLHSVDERTQGSISDRLRSMFRSSPEQRIEAVEYYRHLTEVLLVIAKHGRAVIVGRAAGHLLPHEWGLSVRIVAPFDLRVKRHAQREDIPEAEAAAFIKKRDKEQSRFVQEFVRQNVHDLHQYDLVCNTERLTPTSVAKLIWRTFDQRVIREQQQASGETGQWHVPNPANTPPDPKT